MKQDPFIFPFVLATIVLLSLATVKVSVDSYISIRESNAKVSATISPLRDYQIDITNSGTNVYDGNRLVGVIPFDSCSQFDKLMLKDNE